MNAISRSVGAILILTLLVVGRATAEEPKVKELVGGPESDAVAEEDPATTAPPAPAPGPPDDFARGVPRTSVEGFLSAAEEGDWDLIFEFAHP